MLEQVTIQEFNGGRIIALLEHELAKVKENLNNPSVDMKTKREINLKISFIPDVSLNENEVIGVTINAKASSKLANHPGIGAYAHFKNGELFENSGQINLNFETTDEVVDFAENVKQFKTKEG